MGGLRQGTIAPTCAFGILAILVCMLGSAPAADRTNQRVLQFQTNDGHVSFTLDRSGEQPRQRYDRSAEIILLTPVAAARGDTIYRRDDKRLILRTTPYGALTYFSVEHQAGIPLVRMSAGEPLRPTMRTPDGVRALALILEEHLGLAYGLTVRVETPQVPEAARAGSLIALGDALENTKTAFDRALAPHTAGTIPVSIDAIRFIEEPKVSVQIDAAQLTISIVPKLRLAGRPSSYLIEARLNQHIARQVAQAQKTAEGFAAQAMDTPSHDYEW